MESCADVESCADAERYAAAGFVTMAPDTQLRPWFEEDPDYGMRLFFFLGSPMWVYVGFRGLYDRADFSGWNR